MKTRTTTTKKERRERIIANTAARFGTAWYLLSGPIFVREPGSSGPLIAWVTTRVMEYLQRNKRKPRV